MPDQFVVPQFLDVETKIIGPVTMRQFLIMIGVVLVEALLYKLILNIFALLAVGLPVLAIGIVFAFVKVNGQPFHFIVLNMVLTFRRPMVRVWDKALTTGQIKARLKKEKKEKEIPPPTKRKVPKSRLSELSLVVNTGGIYNPEDHK